MSSFRSWNADQNCRMLGQGINMWICAALRFSSIWNDSTAVAAPGKFANNGVLSLVVCHPLRWMHHTSTNSCILFDKHLIWENAIHGQSQHILAIVWHSSLPFHDHSQVNPEYSYTNFISRRLLWLFLSKYLGVRGHSTCSCHWQIERIVLH